MVDMSDNWTLVDGLSSELTGMDAFCGEEFFVSRVTFPLASSIGLLVLNLFKHNDI